MHCVKSARQLVDVGLNDFAVVHRDWRVGDDVVIHRLVWFIGLKDCALVSRAPRWVNVRTQYYELFLLNAFFCGLSVTLKIQQFRGLRHSQFQICMRH